MPKALILKQLIPQVAPSIAQFEKEIKAANGTMGSAWKDNTNLTDGLIRKILKRYPNVNEKWLETGEGEMFTNRNGHDKESVKADTLHSEPEPVKQQPSAIDYNTAVPAGEVIAMHIRIQEHLTKVNNSLLDNQLMLSNTIATMADLLKDVKDVKTNLNDVAAKQQTFRITTGANFQVILGLLADLRELDRQEVLNSANNLKIALLKLNQGKDTPLGADIVDK